MRSALLAITFLAPIAAQATTTTFASNNRGDVGGSLYFDLDVSHPTGVTIANLDVNLADPRGTSGTIEIYRCATTRVGNQLNPSAWTLVAAGPVTSCGRDEPASVSFAPFALPPGTHGIALVASGVAHAYTNGSGANQTAFASGGGAVPTDLVLHAGEASNGAFAPGLFAPRVPNCAIWFGLGMPNPGEVVAEHSRYGCGCACRASFYEAFAGGSVDLENRSFRMVPTGSGHLLVPSSASFTPPGAGALAVPPTNSLGYPSTLSGPIAWCSQVASSLRIRTDGIVALDSTASIGSSPWIPELLNGTETSWWIHHDMDPSLPGSGQVMLEWDGGTGVLRITWDGVWDAGGTSTANANSFQLNFHVFTGEVEYVFGTLSSAGGPWLVGYSVAGASADLGPIDLSATPSLALCCEDEQLRLCLLDRAVYSTPALRFETSNIPAGTIAHLTGYSVVQLLPGPLLLPSNDCRVYHTWMASDTTLAPPTTNIHTPAFMAPVPPIPPGFVFYAQAAALGVPGVPGGWLTSNGVRVQTGDL